MSGICALLRLDGQPARHEELAPVLAELAPRGPDGAAIAADGAAVLGHALLATTPEALVEPMPFCHAASGCLITADVRLDNRPELMASLGITAAGRVIGDGELILQAYLKWGTDCAEHLLGDFAFVIWEPRRQRLFAARDKVGMRQLAYHHQPGKLFACATDPEALLAHAEVPKTINEARIADYLEWLEAIDHVSTFFAGIVRLPPAHALVIEGGQLRQWRYWQLTAPGPVIYRASDAEYDAAFLEVFTQAVRARLRSPDPVGAMLSGGMDSGTVTAIAAQLLHEAGAPPLQTFSGIDTDPACAETACVRASIAHIAHIAPVIVSTADADSFRDEVRRLTAAESDPFDGHMAMIRAIYLAARKQGIRVILDGVSGDTTLSTGNMIAFHLAAGRFRQAWAEAQGLQRIWGKREAPAIREMARALWRMIAPHSLRDRRRKAWEAREAARAARESILNPDFAARINMAARRRAFARHVRVEHISTPVAQAQRMLQPFAIAGRERYDRVAGALGIEPRDPFLDVRVLDFCLTLPPEQMQCNGWAKFIMRRAMAGRLPDSVRWKPGRDHVGWRFSEICDSDNLQEPVESISSNLSKYLADSSEAAISALRCNKDGLVSLPDLLYLHFWITRVKPYGD